MRIVVLIILSFVLSNIGNSQSCRKKYKDSLEESSKLLRCGGNFTIERLNTGSCILKRYYPENKQIILLATYKSDELKELHGLYEEKWDDGTIVASGMYVNNKKIGQWRENVNQIGLYNDGARDGKWRTFSKDKLVVKIHNYMNGELHGEQISFDSLGNITLKEEYIHGELESTTADTMKMYKEEMPRFPGCENLGLGKEDLLKCSQKKLLEYIYGNIKYPRKSINENIQGKALVQFVIDKDGSITDIKVLNGVTEDIKEEVISLIKKMPKWQPGMQDGNPVRVIFTLPVNFKME